MITIDEFFKAEHENMVQSILDERMKYLLSVDENNIRNALIELGWTPPDPTGLSQEVRQCYSVEGLKKFVAKHHPHLEITEKDGEWLQLNECDVQILNDCGYWEYIYPRKDSDLLVLISQLAIEPLDSVRIRRIDKQENTDGLD